MAADEEESQAVADVSSSALAQRDKVKIEAQFSVGEYDVVVLSAQESTGLEHWLRANNYAIPDHVAPLLRPYIEQGTKFFVAKVDPRKVRFVDGMATLSPLRFSYDSPELTLPIRLGLASSPGTQDLIVNVLAPDTRYEVANHPNITVPTNLVVTEEVRARFGEFYAALFDHALAQVPGAVVTEYAWDAESCDPCPGPTLSPQDLETFGADVLGSSYQGVANRSFTLTRLHARYGKDIQDDLVFRAVSPIQGGRGIPDADGSIDMTVAQSDTNTFQGRYVILHPWTGPVACALPRRGEWGGPPSQLAAEANVKPATNLAFAPRGRVELASLLTTKVPQASLLASTVVSLPMPLRQPQGCGCASSGTDFGAGASGTAAVLAAMALARRRRSI
jgi:uncharacterized protein (TIGR03382 family)